MDFQAARDFITEQLRTGLKPQLTYHSIDHTIDVYESAMRIVRGEVLDEQQMVLLKTAALMHDSGMLVTYQGHEQAAVDLCELWLPKFGYSSEDIGQIGKMILATRLPQKAHSKLEQIICDADLDYLGRDDFHMIAHRLRYEWNTLKIKQTSLREWYLLQIAFLESHTYFTQVAKETRNAGKFENLRQIKEICLKHV
jgi:uncharacterized protein